MKKSWIFLSIWIILKTVIIIFIRHNRRLENESTELRENFYWTGIVDADLRVFDIIMYTEFGTTYNSYVLKTGDKTILFETAKEKFFDDYLEKLKEITDVESIDYLVVEHTEPTMQAVWSGF